MKILVVEDDPHIANSLQQGFREEGFVVDLAHDGHTALEHILADLCDLVVLDVSLPGLDGWEVLRQVRRKGLDVPVILVTARDALDDRVKGLSIGADDYVVKPFAFSELTARVRAVLRRGERKFTEAITYEDLTVDLVRSKVSRCGQEIALSQKELQLLDLLIRHAERVLSRNFIAERVWDITFDGDSNVVDVYVWRLRAKIDEPFERRFIHTVRGRGYVFR
ncbi:response regulator transcription factor [Candidatus Viadribacter manganicus]|uniref:Two-component system response regulator n=1 Tax=Candidatus Viadribacter manganicus TaxID=1759059 RepID=A0A1B1AGP7_9PROT|nr:response regulator transcription factor [Candidatus Viadribacter manganicus]ANP45733.1 two-component system response regulator [Candidatus Viadribacter manganicus]